MFHALMRRFQLELMYCYLFFTVVPSNTFVFLSYRPFVVNTTFSTGIVGVEVSSVSWHENVLTSKGLQERNTKVFDGTTVKNR